MSNPNTSGGGSGGEYRVLLGAIPGIEPVKYAEMFGSPELRLLKPGFLVVGRIVPGKGGDVDIIRVSPLTVSFQEPKHYPDGSTSVGMTLLHYTHYALSCIGPSTTGEELRAQLASSPRCSEFGLQGNATAWRLSGGGYWLAQAGNWELRRGMRCELWQDGPDSGEPVHVVTRLTPAAEGAEGLAGIAGMMLEAMGVPPNDVRQILRVIPDPSLS